MFGITLNGNTLVVVAAAVLMTLMICTTIIAATGGAIPGFFSEIGLALVTALGAGGVVNHVNTHQPTDNGTTPGK